MADNEITEVEIHPLVGLPHGHVDENNEKVVYEIDDDGIFVGWHKEGK